MLSRVADALFWMSRYVERSEHVARLLDVWFHLELDLAGAGAAPYEMHWTALAAILQSPRVINLWITTPSPTTPRRAATRTSFITAFSVVALGPCSTGKSSSAKTRRKPTPSRPTRTCCSLRLFAIGDEGQGGR